MNSAKETVRKAIFGKLRSLRRKLNAQGVPCAYSRSVLSGPGFKITYQPGNNGDASLLPTVSIRTGDTQHGQVVRLRGARREDDLVRFC